MKVIRGTCNRCGECCGKTTNKPPFGWGFFEIILQTEGNTDFPFDALPEEKRYIWSWVNAALDNNRNVRIGSRNYTLIVRTGVGLIKEDGNNECPFLLTDGSCGIWDEVSVSIWHDALCKSAFPYNGFVLPDGADNYEQFFVDHPSCSYYINEE